MTASIHPRTSVGPTHLLAPVLARAEAPDTAYRIAIRQWSRRRTRGTRVREEVTYRDLAARIEATAREIDKVFGLHGISRIAATGLPLDPNQHQAMLEVPSADVEPGTVVQELQAGYMIKDRLLRPAMVAVAKKPD